LSHLADNYDILDHLVRAVLFISKYTDCFSGRLGSDPV